VFKLPLFLTLPLNYAFTLGRRSATLFCLFNGRRGGIEGVSTALYQDTTSRFLTRPLSVKKSLGVGVETGLLIMSVEWLNYFFGSSEWTLPCNPPSLFNSQKFTAPSGSLDCLQVSFPSNRWMVNKDDLLRAGLHIYVRRTIASRSALLCLLSRC